MTVKTLNRCPLRALLLSAVHIEASLRTPTVRQRFGERWRSKTFLEPIFELEGEESELHAEPCLQPGGVECADALDRLPQSSLSVRVDGDVDMELELDSCFVQADCIDIDMPWSCSGQGGQKGDPSNGKYPHETGGYDEETVRLIINTHPMSAPFWSSQQIVPESCRRKRSSSDLDPDDYLNLELESLRVVKRRRVSSSIHET